MIAWGEDPVPTLCLPTESRFITGDIPSSSEISTATAPRQSSKGVKPLATCSREFIPNLGTEPPPITTTFLNSPDLTREDAMIIAPAGPAQNARTSTPLALRH